MTARDVYFGVLLDGGMLTRQPGAISVTVPRASEIREVIRLARSEDRSLINNAEKKWRKAAAAGAR